MKECVAEMPVPRPEQTRTSVSSVVMEAGVTGAMMQEAKRENTGGVNVLVERRVQTPE